MEDLKTLFAGRTRLSDAPKTPHTAIFFKPKCHPDHKALVREALGFEKSRIYFKSFIHFNLHELEILRQYGLKHKHDGILQVRSMKY